MHLTRELGWECTFVTSIDTTMFTLPFNHINYRIDPAAPQPKTFYNPDDFATLEKHMKAIYLGLRGAPQFKPDLVVGHMSYGTWLWLRALYPNARFIGYFEILNEPFWKESLSMRHDFPVTETVRIFNAMYHAFTHLHLHACDAFYTPTNYQMGTCPQEWRHKGRVIHDGIDTDFFKPRPLPRPYLFRGVNIPVGAKVVTYLSRGLESARGFDIFMKVAKRVAAAVPEAIFLVAGSDRTNYGHENHHIPQGMTFKDWVLSQDTYPLDRIHFLGIIPGEEFKAFLDLSDLHIYLTVPYVLSWSMLQAMANGCAVLSSKTAPVEEVIRSGYNGVLRDFYDDEGLAAEAVYLLRYPKRARLYGDNARQTVLDRYEARKCVGELVEYFKEVTG